MGCSCAKQHIWWAARVQNNTSFMDVFTPCWLSRGSPFVSLYKFSLRRYATAATAENIQAGSWRWPTAWRPGRSRDCGEDRHAVSEMSTGEEEL